MIIYKITNRINGKRYIGQTIQNLKQRWDKHCSRRKNSALSAAILFYGKENFETKVLCKCDFINEMNHREQYYIKLFNTLAPNGYNLTTGGNNGLHLEDTKKKISESQSSNKNHMFGKKVSQETKNKQSSAHKGRIKTLQEIEKLRIANTGKKFTKERCENISKSLVGRIVPRERVERMIVSMKKSEKRKIAIENMRGKTLSEEQKYKISQGLKKSEKVSAFKKPILCVETNQTFKSITEAAKALQTSTGKICAVLSGKRNHTKGYTFKRVG